jgi:hypothetical protein
MLERRAPPSPARILAPVRPRREEAIAYRLYYSIESEGERSAA